MGICRDSRHKRRETGGRRQSIHKKRKFEMGRQPAMTKIGPKKIQVVRGRGGNSKFRAQRLETGNFSWGTEVCTRKVRILDVNYNASNNEVRLCCVCCGVLLWGFVGGAGVGSVERREAYIKRHA